MRETLIRRPWRCWSTHISIARSAKGAAGVGEAREREERERDGGLRGTSERKAGKRGKGHGVGDALTNGEPGGRAAAVSEGGARTRSELADISELSDS